MSLSIFSEKAHMPDNQQLSMFLGAAKTHFETIRQHIAKTCKNVNEEWKFYGKEAGWTLAVICDKRRLFNLIPFQGYFSINIVFGEKAVKAAKNADLPENILKLIPDEKQCVCGHGFTVDIKTQTDADIAIKLIEIKRNN